MKLMLVAAVSTALLISSHVRAEEFPERAIRIIVPHGAGGSTDIMTRLLATPLSEELGQGIAVVNVDGGGTAIGAQQAATSKADGYTLLLTHVALLTSSAMGANPLGPQSLTPVAQVGRETQIIAVPSGSKMQTFKDFMLAASTDTPEKPKLGVSPGAGNHFAFLQMLASLNGNDAIFVPTGGGGPTMHELLGNHIDVGTFVISEAADQIAAGTIRPLAVFSKQRHPDLPDVPTAAEQGYEVEINLDYVLYAPKDTPQDRIATLAQGVKATIGDKAFDQQMVQRSIEPAFDSGETLTARLNELWKTIQQLASTLQKK